MESGYRSNEKEVFSLGICLGSSSISSVLISRQNGSFQILEKSVKSHHGVPQACLEALVQRFQKYPLDSYSFVHKIPAEIGDTHVLSEPEAIEAAYSRQCANDRVDAIVSAGGSTVMVYTLDAKGQISGVYSGNKCASGTGEFFLQQLGRMNLSLQEALRIAEDTNQPYRVSSRCSVFCKSDCTHALNKGTAKERVVAGLCQMMAIKIAELLQQCGARRVLFIGGVSQNKIVAQQLRQIYPHLIVPQEAAVFEALGAALAASQKAPPQKTLKAAISSLNNVKERMDSLPPLKSYSSLVTFLDMPPQKLADGDECIIGLDVGSTTTKAVLLRTSDSAIVASIYLRTNGDPIGAARNCYSSLAEQAEGFHIRIIGLGVTGSGRQIAGLHGLATSVVNEITAHASAAKHVDPDVDTVFEIGGQDAKYTYLVNNVATDYAMNEACSAGTGSFIEEAAGENLKLHVQDIAPLALKAESPLNFSDECSAFIASDITKAIQHGYGHEDIVAGIVYSICMNYLARVKQNRPVGKKILMQGGVCYNRAIPLAMAGLVERCIIVPPEPGLMGALGVALEVQKRLQEKIAYPGIYNLNILKKRELAFKEPFICRGGREKCQRGCEIARIVVEGKTYPFGGACKKYERMLLNNPEISAAEYNHVRQRQDLVFASCESSETNISSAPVVGINRSFLMNSFMPLFKTFFEKIGCKIDLPTEIPKNAQVKPGAAFCYPLISAHASLENLLSHDPDYIFMPVIKELPLRQNGEHARTCVLLQFENSCLRSAFGSKKLPGSKLLTPVLSFANGYSDACGEMLKVAKQLGVPKRRAENAYNEAVHAQQTCELQTRQIGEKALVELESDPGRFGIVILGRPYNALNDWLNMNIPNKFASRGLHVIPFDALPLADQQPVDGMYWGIGHDNLLAAQFIKRHPQLFGVFISNFSCGPDSFLLSYFRNIMKSKPSLTLELDCDTADVGIDTRIDAFVDIVEAYRNSSHSDEKIVKSHTDVRVRNTENKIVVENTTGGTLRLNDKRVKVVVPEMNPYNSRALAAGLRRYNLRAEVLAADEKALRKGRLAGTCKECLPFHLTTGALVNYLDQRRDEDEVTLFFMSHSHGPCRQGQYTPGLQQYLAKSQYRNVAVFSMDGANTFTELGKRAALFLWHLLVLGDIFLNLRQALRVLAKQPEQALKELEKHYLEILDIAEHSDLAGLYQKCQQCAEALTLLPLTENYADAPKVRILGEVYVRGNDFCTKNIVEVLAHRGIVPVVAPLSEYMYYVDYLRRKGYSATVSSPKRKLKDAVVISAEKFIERKLMHIFNRTGLLSEDHPSVDDIAAAASHFLNTEVGTEAVLSTGLAAHDILNESCGVISIGPFSCMPARTTEAIFHSAMDVDAIRQFRKPESLRGDTSVLKRLPWIAIEVDGRPMPQLTEAKLNAFCLQASRLHEQMKSFQKQ